MQENYSAWQPKTIAERQGKLDFLIDYAILAPSSHNSQPWAFKVRSDQIFVYANLNRRLEASDANDRQLYISLGCAISNIKIAANAFGLAASVEYVDNNEDNLSAIVSIKRKIASESNDRFLAAIFSRTNNRNPYEARKLPENFISELRSLAPPKIRLDVVTEPTKRKALAETAIQAGIEAMESRFFRRELNHYVKTNFTRSPFGMPGFGMGIPSLISLFAPTMIKYVNMNRITKAKDLLLLTDQTPALGIISSTDDSKVGWLKTGEFLQEINVRAESIGIRTGMWAAPIQIANYYREFQRILDIEERPEVFFRLGYTSKVPRHSPRLTSENVFLSDD